MVMMVYHVQEYVWYKRFRDGHVDIKDDEHPGSKKSVVTERSQNFHCVTWKLN